MLKKFKTFFIALFFLLFFSFCIANVAEAARIINSDGTGAANAGTFGSISLLELNNSLKKYGAVNILVPASKAQYDLSYKFQINESEIGGFSFNKITFIQLLKKEKIADSWQGEDVLATSESATRDGDRYLVRDNALSLDLSENASDVQFYAKIYYEDSVTSKIKYLTTNPKEYPAISAPAGEETEKTEGNVITGAGEGDDATLTTDTGNKRTKGSNTSVNRVGSPLSIKCATYEGQGKLLIYCFLGKIMRFLLWLSAVLTVIMIIIGGFFYMTSGGNPEALKKAKEVLPAAIVGAVIVITSWAIVSFVGKKILNTTPAPVDNAANEAFK